MPSNQRNHQRRRFDLEERTFVFAKRVIAFTRRPPRTIANREVLRQLVRAAGSVGANYIEANEALSRKDFFYRVKVCRKEAKESCYWLRLVDLAPEDEDEQAFLIQEATELMNIFGAMVRKLESRSKRSPA